MTHWTCTPPARESGTASLELIIGCLAAIPLFLGISLLGKYADMRHKTVEAARYVAWEDIIWRGGRTGSDHELAASDRLTGHRSSSIVDESVLAQEGVSEDPLWRDQSSRTLMVSDGSTIRVNIDEQKNAGSTSHGAGITTAAGKAGLSLDTITRYEVSMAATNRLRIPNQGEETNLFNFFDPGHYLPAEVMDFTASSAILTDTWQADELDDYKSRIRGMTVEEIPVIGLDTAVWLGTSTFGHFPLFKEGRYGANPDVVAEPEDLLEEYKP